MAFREVHKPRGIPEYKETSGDKERRIQGDTGMAAAGAEGRAKRTLPERDRTLGYEDGSGAAPPEGLGTLGGQDRDHTELYLL